MPLASPRYPFTEWAVAGAPDDPGLYALYDHEKLLCIGVALARDASDTIRARLLAHFEASRPTTSATHYKWEITRYPLRRRAEYLAALERDVLRCEDAQVGIRRERG